MEGKFASRSEAVEGWQGRMRGKLAFAAGTGIVVGSLLAVLNNAPLVRHTATSTASFVIVMGCFSVLQETVRLARCADSPLNGCLAGAGTGAFLFRLHGGHPIKGAAVCASLGGAAQWAAAKVDLSHGMRSALVSLDLLDDSSRSSGSSSSVEGAPGGSGSAESAAAAAAAAAGEGSGGWFERLAPYLPVRKFSEEEWEEYKKQQDETQRKRIEVALEGGLPVMVERKRQRAQQAQQQDEPSAGG